MAHRYQNASTPQELDRIQRLENLIRHELEHLYTKKGYPLQRPILLQAFYETFSDVGLNVILQKDGSSHYFLLQNPLRNSDALLQINTSFVDLTLPGVAPHSALSLRHSFEYLSEFYRRNNFSGKESFLVFEDAFFLNSVFHSAIVDLLATFEEQAFLPFSKKQSSFSKPTLFSKLQETSLYSHYLHASSDESHYRLLLSDLFLRNFSKQYHYSFSSQRPLPILTARDFFSYTHQHNHSSSYDS